MQTLNTESNPDEIVEQLEPAMAELEEDDRGALVLRFLEDRNFREVGDELGISEDAARMRVNRAVERLREVFARRGAVVTSAALAGVLATATVKAVPAGLTAAIVAGGAVGTLTTVTIMSWINAKSVAAIAAAAILAGTASYLVQKQKTDQLQAQIDASRTQLEQAKADTLAARQALALRNQEMQKSQADALELAKTRNEIAQLRQQREASAQAAAKATASPAKPAGPTAFPPGTYVKREQLAFAGYSTPEATIQSLAWAATTGQTNIVQRTVSTDLPQGQQLAEELKQALVGAGPFLEGFQVMAEKSLAEDRVEVLVKLDSRSIPGLNLNLPPPLNIVPMIRVDNEWKLGAPPEDYSPDWQKTGQIKTFAQ